MLTPSGDVVFDLRVATNGPCSRLGILMGKCDGGRSTTVIAVGELGKVLRVSTGTAELEIATAPRLLGDLHSVESAGGGFGKQWERTEPARLSWLSR